MRIIKLLPPILTLLLQITACQSEDSSTPLTAGITAPQFQPQECWFSIPEGRSADCGYMHVQENRSKPDSAIIRFPVVIFRTTMPTSKPDPVILLGGGGPGAPVYLNKEFVDIYWDGPERFALESGRDLIVIDQRGAGMSQPSLACAEIRTASETIFSRDMSIADEGILYKQAALACRDRLEGDGVDLSAYHSVSSALDVEELRVALGYESWNLFGTSYAGRLALTIMREHPSAVRSAIIDSAEIPSALFYEEGPYSVHRALEALNNACNTDQDCQQNYGSLMSKLTLLHDYYREQKPVIKLDDPFSGKPFSFVITGSRFSQLLFDIMYQRESLSTLPYIIDRLSEEPEDQDTLSFLVESFLWTLLDPFWSDGLYYSIGCYEELPFNDLNASIRISRGYPFGSEFHQSWVNSEKEICAVWNDSKAPDIEQMPVVSDIPIAIFSGNFDPVSPPRWGATVNNNFSNSVLYNFMHEAHGVIGGGNKCAQDLAKAFLDIDANADLDNQASPACIDDRPIDFE